MADSVTNPHRDILDILICESEAYSNLEEIEKYLQEGSDLSQFPIQPLYQLLKSVPTERAAQALIKFTKEQREVFLDLDLWEKDDLDLQQFSFWIKTYSQCTAIDIRIEFAKSAEFALYLKSKFNIYTFDVEDPVYPEHNNYFLTDDNLLLFEFEEDYDLIEEVQRIIKTLYAEVGVENAYSILFKLVTDSYMHMLEEEYQLKKERLRDFGFVDYYDSLEIESTFTNLNQLDKFLTNKIQTTANIDSLGKVQALHPAALVAYKSDMGAIQTELKKVTSQKRIDFLHFNFIRLVNASLSLSGSLKGGQVAMNRVGQKTRSLLLLGFDYIKNTMREKIDNNGPFTTYDFIDCYKVGNSLVKETQKKIRKAMTGSGFKEEDPFLGQYWIEFLRNSFAESPKFLVQNESVVIISHDIYCKWARQAKTLIELLPFAKKFCDVYNQLKKSGTLQDNYYLNFNVNDIDLEAILLSILGNFMLKIFDDPNIKKIGLTIDEFKQWTSMITDYYGKIKIDQRSKDLIDGFQKQFGLNEISGFYSFLIDILRSQLEGYEFHKLKSDDFKHVGGPIILVR